MKRIIIFLGILIVVIVLFEGLMQVYSGKPLELRNLKYQKDIVKQLCPDNIQDFRNIPNFKKGFNKYWFIYIGQTYGRLKCFMRQ